MWFLPTYGRPESFTRLRQSTGGLPPPDKLQVLLTEDDPRRGEYDTAPYRQHVIPARSLGDVFRWIVPNFKFEKFYGIITDDFELIKPQWWEVLEVAAADRFIASAFKDGDSGMLPGIPCFGGGLVRAMGTIMPVEGIHHNSTDVVWYTIGLEFNLLKLDASGMVYHRHPIYGTAEMDDTYKRGAFNPVFKENDPIAFNQWANSDARRLMNERIKTFLGR